MSINHNKMISDLFTEHMSTATWGLLWPGYGYFDHFLKIAQHIYLKGYLKFSFLYSSPFYPR